MNTTAAPVVGLVRKLPAPRPPNIVAPPPPPNTAPPLAPLPRCNSTTAIRNKHTITWRTVTTTPMRSFWRPGPGAAGGQNEDVSPTLLLLEFDDPGECRGIETRAAHQRAVDVGLRHQVVDVLGLHRPAVLDPDRVPRSAEARPQALAHERVDLLGGLRSGGAAGTDRPDRLVCDHELAGARFGHQREAARELPRHHVDRAAGLALLERFADADDRHDVRREQGRGLVRHVRVALPVVGPPLAVTDDHVATAELGQHSGGDLARERALRVRVHILCREVHVR